MIKSIWAYSFLTGMFIGGYTNLFSKIVISSLVLYIVNPENFNPRRFYPLCDRIYETSYPYLSKIYSFSEPLLQLEDRVSVIPSPKSSPSLPLPPLPPLKLKIEKKS